MGENFQDNQNSILNTTVDNNAKLVGEQDEIFNVDKIDWEKHSWNICHWLVMKQLSIFSAQKSTSSQRFCVVFWKDMNIRSPT